MQSISRFRTANGVVHADPMVECKVPDLDGDVSALMLEKCPPVLSLGQRIAQGYKFTWCSAHGSCLTVPSGKVIHMRTVNYVPILDEGTHGSMLEQGQEDEQGCPSEVHEGETEEDEFEEAECDDDNDATPDDKTSYARKDYMNRGRCKSGCQHTDSRAHAFPEESVRADNAKEYEFAIRALGLAWYRSTPHRHQSNGKIERCIRSVCEMTWCALTQSGLSHGHWPYAMEHATMMRNILVPDHRIATLPMGTGDGNRQMS
eukprot:5926189-Amphidinium_carterae.4